jgi:hypothetical protein
MEGASKLPVSVEIQPHQSIRIICCRGKASDDEDACIGPSFLKSAQPMLSLKNCA